MEYLFKKKKHFNDKFLNKTKQKRIKNISNLFNNRCKYTRKKLTKATKKTHINTHMAFTFIIFIQFKFIITINKKYHKKVHKYQKGIYIDCIFKLLLLKIMIIPK